MTTAQCHANAERECLYCKTPIRRGKYCCPACGDLWRESQRDEMRDEKPVEILEPVLRCYAGLCWRVVGTHIKNLRNSA